MTKTELIASIAKKAGLRKAAAENALKATLETISETLAQGDKVQLVGFGTFSVLDKPAHEGFNPRTKEKIQIPARKAVKFKAASNLV